MSRVCRFIFNVNVDITLNRLYYFIKKGVYKCRYQADLQQHYIFLHVQNIFKDKEKITSDFLSGSIRSNPVIIRNILSQLKKAGLINVVRGTGGIEIIKDPSEITFYDVYKAVEAVKEDGLFHFHEEPNPACPVGKNIHEILDGKLSEIQDAMENKMKTYTLLDIEKGIKEI